MDKGQLIDAQEAKVLAVFRVCAKDTLFSVSRAVAWETGVKHEEIFPCLCEAFPEFT